MYSDVVSLDTGSAGFDAAAVMPARSCGVFDQWVEWPISELSHHAKRCCEVAREWLGAMDMSLLAGGKLTTGPRWLRSRFDWGPTRYPIHWCEALERKSLDCGVHAALAYEVFSQRGVRAYRAQIVQEFLPQAAQHWSLGWQKQDTSTGWLNGRNIYHEATAIQTSESNIKLWDPSAGWWVEPRTNSGYGAVRAIRVVSPADAELQWGGHTFTTNQWEELVPA
jgi:hypothetical protein